MTLSLAALIDSPALGPRPFLTWYGADGERIEISATVTANWVTKSANLLVEEFDLEAGSLVRLDLPPHWRTAVWALAVWRTGAGVVLGAGSAGALARADVIVTDRPAELAAAGQVGTAELVAQVLPSLARRFDGELPAGAMDAAQAVGTYSDVIGYMPPADPSATAVVVGETATVHSTTTAYSALGDWAAEVPPSARLGVTLPAAPPSGTALSSVLPSCAAVSGAVPADTAEPSGDRDPEVVERYLRLVLGALRAKTSLVLLPAGHPDPERILATEHATAHPFG